MSNRLLGNMILSRGSWIDCTALEKHTKKLTLSQKNQPYGATEPFTRVGELVTSGRIALKNQNLAHSERADVVDKEKRQTNIGQSQAMKDV